MNAELSKPKRIQGAYISEEEMKRVIDYLKGDEPPVYDESVVDNGVNGSVSVFGKSSGSTDPIFLEAKKIIIESGKASASFLQRRLKLGYARAARILDELEAAGVVGPADGAKPREILVRDMEDAEILEDKKYFDGEDESTEETDVDEGVEEVEGDIEEDSVAGDGTEEVGEEETTEENTRENN
jgi:DNA segregation ATPase FtsK/SpoIIIE-like protein